MSSKLLTAPEREGKTFHVAIRVLGTFAVIQILLVTWSVLIRFNGEEINRTRAMGIPASFPVASLATPRPENSAHSLPEIYRPVPQSASPPESPQEPDGSPASAAESDSRRRDQPAILLAQNSASPFSSRPDQRRNHQAHRISEPEARELVDRALDLREEGDTQGALEALRDADAVLPSHPKILAELATTLQRMGLETKAADYWERVHQMQPEGAGAYWDLADMALKGQILEDITSIDTYLRIARHTARSVPTSSEAQQIVLRIHIEAERDKAVSGEDMYLNVLFYDAVDGKAYEPTVADTKPHYISQPYDWRDGVEEIIEVEYFLPELPADQRATLGEREFYGYVVELYYKDLLQDIVARPRKLARLGSSVSRAARPVADSLPDR